MGAQLRARSERVDAWLAQGGVVLTSTERAARAVAAAFHSARQAEGHAAWTTPAVFAWDAWVKEQWAERNRSGLMLLNPLQEQALWARVIRSRPAVEGVLDTGRLAASAMQAYRLLWMYAPAALNPTARLGWLGDAAIFSDWLTGFEDRCRREAAISASRITHELTSILLAENLEPSRESTEQAPLLLIGFDRLLASQEMLLSAWGTWMIDKDELIGTVASRFFAVSDADDEIEACAAWLRAKLATDPKARLMVVTPGLREHRGEQERALLDVSSAREAEALQFEFSLGVPLMQVGVVRNALLLMRWMIQPLSEPEMDWLLGSGYCSGSADEEIALAETMLALRSHGMERPEWTLEAFYEAELPEHAPPVAWTGRLDAAGDLLRAAPRRQSPLEWVRFTELFLEIAGWPGFRPASSVVFQARERWERVLEECGSLGFDGREMDWAEFVGTVAAAVSDTIFALESTDAAVQITEPAASAGLVADGIWFLGADEANWPGCGQAHPLLPIGLQREAGMPHASPQADWTLAQETTRRLLGSADEVIFSYARQAAEVETRPSRLVVQEIGIAQELPEELRLTRAFGADTQLCETFEDGSRIPFPLETIAGGAGTWTSQSLCPFQAFATARLGATKWEPAEAGLNARQRGQLLHAVMHRVWSGKVRGGIGSLAELESVGDVAGFVRGVVLAVLRENSSLRRFLVRFPQRLVELETERLTRLVAEWLAYERQRLPFAVAQTEARTEVTIAGLTLRLQLDRVDVLDNGSKLVIDYKSGDVGPAAWRGARPDDVQLPLYAAFAVGEDLEGLVFGRIRPGEMKFCGRVRDANGLLITGLHPSNGLVKEPLTDDQLDQWRRLIERLGADLMSGRADVNPKDPVKTCERCHLHAVCRINENQTVDVLMAGDEDDGNDADGGLDG